MKKIVRVLLILSLTFIFSFSFMLKEVFAYSSYFALSPMYQMMTLTPGETVEGNFSITNPASATEDFYYELRVEPFSTDNNNDISLVANGDYNQIVNWITLYEPEGLVVPNSVKEIRFSIAVPENAPAGGQYASIVVNSKAVEDNNTNVDIQEVFESAHLIYADIAGETERGGDVYDMDVPGFLFSGNIAGTATIKNEGNVHSQATSTLQVFPLFSSEEVFTNEENPKKGWIMPGNTTMSTLTWEETPSMGIFHVIYNVEYEGVESKIDKMVIVCPLWILFVILVLIFLIIFKILSGKREKK